MLAGGWLVWDGLSWDGFSPAPCVLSSCRNESLSRAVLIVRAGNKKESRSPRGLPEFRLRNDTMSLPQHHIGQSKL